jgi:hypothetical protein
MAVTQRRLAARQDTPANVPMPMTLECKVVNTFSERTLTVRLPDKAGGPQRTAWQRAWQGLKQAEEAGWPTRGAQQLYARAVGLGDRIAYATTGGAWDELKFFFPPGEGSVYGQLIGKPGLYAFVTIDWSKGYYMNCTFRHLP